MVKGHIEDLQRSNTRHALPTTGQIGAPIAVFLLLFSGCLLRRYRALAMIVCPCTALLVFLRPLHCCPTSLKTLIEANKSRETLMILSWNSGESLMKEDLRESRMRE